MQKWIVIGVIILAGGGCLSGPAATTTLSRFRKALKSNGLKCRTSINGGPI